MTKVHSLEIGGGIGCGAYAACVYQNFLFVVNYKGIHIFDASRNYQKLEEYDFGETLLSMHIFKSQDSDQQLIVCGTDYSKIFVVKASADSKSMKNEFSSNFKSAINLNSGSINRIE